MDYVIIRATFGRFGEDKKFKQNANGCLQYEIPFTFYYYSYALTEKEATEEVNHFLETIKEYKEKISFPVVIDMEDSDSYKLNHGVTKKEELTNICITACEEIIKNNLKAMIYANADWFKNKLEEERLSKYFKWIAVWNEKEDEEKLKKKYIMWQYSNKGKIAGINGNVDLNYSFVDFPKLNKYVDNLSKIETIKYLTKLEDLDIQFLSCYKWRSRLD